MRTLLARLATVLLFAIPGAGHAQVALEYAIKATYLYKFAPFVEWPPTSFESPTAALNICIVGADPFGATLDQAAAGQRAAEHPIAIRRLASPAAGCQIMFVAGPADVIAPVLDAIRGTPVLTVTDAPSGASTHGIINFVVEANHVRFDIDDEAAARNGLVISSKLLRLARAVRQRP